MPVPLSKDLRTLALSLCMQGLTPTAIANQLGVKAITVSQWKHRAGLGTTLRQAKEIVSACPKQVNDLTARSARARIRAANIVDAEIELLEKHPPKLNDIGGRDGRANTVRTVIQTASEVYGWNQDREKVNVRLEVLTDSYLASTPDANHALGQPQPPALAQGQAQAQVIDIAPPNDHSTLNPPSAPIPCPAPEPSPSP